MYEEHRVRVKNFGSLPATSPLLVSVASTPGRACMLHVLAAESFVRMAAAIKTELSLELAIVSGWRRHAWRSREHYEAEMIKRYGSVAEGSKWKAFNSPHETGLAMDIGVGGLWPDRKTAPAQREQPLHKWLVEHAWKYGWTPYKREPWHWERHVSRKAWETGSAS